MWHKRHQISENMGASPYQVLYGAKRDGDEWAWVVNVAPTAAAVWDERTCEVAGGAAKKMPVQFSELDCCIGIGMSNMRRPC